MNDWEVLITDKKRVTEVLKSITKLKSQGVRQAMLAKVLGDFSSTTDLNAAALHGQFCAGYTRAVYDLFDLEGAVEKLNQKQSVQELQDAEVEDRVNEDWEGY